MEVLSKKSARSPCWFNFASLESTKVGWAATTVFDTKVHENPWSMLFFGCVSWSVPMLRHCTCPPPTSFPFFVVVYDSVRISDRVARIVGWVVSYNLEGMCQEAVMAWSRYFPGICLEGLRKTTRTSMLWPRVESIVFRLQVEGVPVTPARSVLPPRCLYRP